MPEKPIIITNQKLEKLELESNTESEGDRSPFGFGGEMLDHSPFLPAQDMLAWSDDAEELFKPMLVMDPEKRVGAAEKIVKTLAKMTDKIQFYREWIRICAFDCPFSDVKDIFLQFVQNLKEEHGIVIEEISNPVSTFIANFDETPDTKSQQKRVDQTSQFLQMNFIQNPHITNLTKVLALHPKFAFDFQSSLNFILRGKGVLPAHYRHYIAIMASSRFSCEYLITQESEEFLFSGGDEEWLEGIHKAPIKLQNLCQVNAILAHQPWILTENHIKPLLCGNDQWTMSELVHAIVILTTYHELCSIVLGCGIQPEYNVGEAELNSLIDEDELDDGSSKDDNLIQKLSELELLIETSDGKKNRELFEKSECDLEGEVTRLHDETSLQQKFSGEGNTMVYKNFDCHSKEYKIHVIQDFSWDQDAFALLTRYYPGCAEVLDKEFRSIHDLTYGTINTFKSDTSKIRNAIRRYIYRIYGMIDDTFDYALVNTILTVPLKKYLKMTTCFPDQIKKSYFDVMHRLFKDSEKVHVNFLASESKKQCSLLYGLLQISKCF